MPDWQERITRETEPAIRAEHDLRYRIAVPLIVSSSVWVDLGCGYGLAAGAALENSFGGHAVLVDLEEEVVRGAEHELLAGSVTTVTADLADPDDLQRVRAALLSATRTEDRVITCFEVVEHLATFVPLVQMLIELADSGAATSVLSVPNDAFWSIENPHHETMWGEGAFAELLALLPQSRVTARQVSLNGSAVLLDDRERERPDSAELKLLADSEVPTHFIVALGPRATELGIGALVAQTDLSEQRLWERQRESYNAFLEGELDAARSDLERLVAERDQLARIVRSNSAEFDSWRGYVHDLEGQLGLPPSGTPKRRAFDLADGSKTQTPAGLPPGDSAEQDTSVTEEDPPS
jgi:SAM-dependent methyltransferase